MPTQGDVVYVSEYNDYTGETTVSPALVTHVYDESDGDPAWWDAAKDKAIVDATVFRRNGTVEAGTFGKSETVTIDDGSGNTQQFKVGYATSPDGHNDDAQVQTTQAPALAAPEAPAAPAAPSVPSPGTTDATAANTGSTVPTPADTGTTTDTVGDGTAPAGSATNPDGSPAL